MRNDTEGEEEARWRRDRLYCKEWGNVQLAKERPAGLTRMRVGRIRAGLDVLKHSDSGVRPWSLRSEASLVLRPPGLSRPPPFTMPNPSHSWAPSHAPSDGPSLNMVKTVIQMLVAAGV